MAWAYMTRLMNPQKPQRATAILACVGGSFFVSMASQAQTGKAPEEHNAETGAPVVVEYFLSQSCSACMATSEFFSELATRDDIIALSWHVDYWNILNTKNGNWVDPYSATVHTDRQRQYNRSIRHRSSVYTPQMVIAGTSEASGRSPEKVTGLIDAAKAVKPVGIRTLTNGGMNNEIIFEIGKSDNGGNAYLVMLKPEIETRVTHGENAGHTYKDINVVTEIRPLGVVLKSGTQINAPILADDEHCALIVQEPKQGRIIAAAYCPAS